MPFVIDFLFLGFKVLNIKGRNYDFIITKKHKKNI